MASAARRLITVDEFLRLEFDPAVKAELSNGVIHVVRMMGGGSSAHARVQGNIFAALFVKLRGSGCRPFGPDMAVRSHELSMRLPDVSVFCGRTTDREDQALAFDDPKMLVEVLSPSTTREDRDVKLPEYMALPSNNIILYVDPIAETVELYQRDDRRAWSGGELDRGDEIKLESLGIALTWEEIFSRD
jgi:Uma2 family endonuclease